MFCPYTSPQNGKVEHILRTINNMLRSLLFQASILACYWVEGLHTTTYLLNRLTTKAINTTIPYFTLHGVAPSYEHLRVFSCACYPNLSTKAAHKLAPQSTKCVFLGYSADHKGYRCLNLTTNNIVISRHVVFYKADFPFSTLPHLTNDFDIFLQDNSPSTAPMPAPLLVPRVPLGFPSLAAAGGQTTPRIEAGGPTVSPGGQIAPGTEADGPTAHPGGQTTHRTEVGGPTTRPFVAPSLHAAPTTPPAPCTTPVSMTLTAPPVAPTSQHYWCRPRAVWEPPASPLHQQSPTTKVVLVAPTVNPHPMTT
jgi:hypothetical protein